MDGPTPREYAFSFAALLLVALNLAREGAVDAPTPFVWRAPGFPVGNLCFAYWHARATLLDDDSADALSVRLVRSPLLGGRTMAGMGWPGVQRFLSGVT